MASMGMATYKDLCIDANDARRVGEFWAAALGRELRVHDDGQVLLTGPTKQHTIWVNAVPEPVSVKQRVHLDVHTGAVDDLLAIGATDAGWDTPGWTVLRDPEGGELCAFVRERVRPSGSTRSSSTAPSPLRSPDGGPNCSAAGWGHQPEQGFSYVDQIPGAPFESLVFTTVPETKTVKNRIHLDVSVDDVAALVARGATILRAPDSEIEWTVLADPDGNEFCAFTD